MTQQAPAAPGPELGYDLERDPASILDGSDRDRIGAAAGSGRG